MREGGAARAGARKRAGRKTPARNPLERESSGGLAIVVVHQAAEYSPADNFALTGILSRGLRWQILK